MTGVLSRAKGAQHHIQNRKRSSKKLQQQQQQQQQTQPYETNRERQDRGGA